MNYQLLQHVLKLMEDFDLHQGKTSDKGIDAFTAWIFANELKKGNAIAEPEWQGKGNGRSADGAISTLLVQLNRFAKQYSKAAIHDSPFSTQEEFIFLINLRTFGQLTKMELIKMNFIDKPTGVQIINRLIKNMWVIQKASLLDKRSRLLRLSDFGKETLDEHIDKIRMASSIVAGNLTVGEKMDLIRLLEKLSDFHQAIFLQNINLEELLTTVDKQYLAKTKVDQ